MKISQIEDAMREALFEARLSLQHYDVPVGAVVLNSRGKIISRAHNKRELRRSPEAHAEVLALQQAAQTLGTWNLSGHHLVVTLEPCLMCTGALVQTRIEKVWFGATDDKGGAIESTYDVGRNNKTNHHFQFEGGILSQECAQLLKNFFQDLRIQKKDRPRSDRDANLI